MRYSLRPCARALPCHSILSKPIPFRQQRPDRSPHLESNLRPCIKIHSNPSTWLLSRPFRVPIANRCPIPQMTYIVLENQLPNLYSLLGLPSYAIYFCFSNHSPWNECSLTPRLIPENSGFRLPTSPPPPRTRHVPFLQICLQPPFHSSRSSLSYSPPTPPSPSFLIPPGGLDGRSDPPLPRGKKFASTHLPMVSLREMNPQLQRNVSVLGKNTKS